MAAIDGAGNASAVSSSAGGTTSAPVRADTYAYDLADRLVGITPASGAASSFTFDALGRHLTKTESGITDTYTYAGERSVVVRDAPSSGTRTNAAVDATGSRLAISTSAGGFGWALADLHGDPAGYVAAAGGVVTDAARYDPYGEVSASVSSGLPSPWGYQGRLQLADATDTSLLDFGFRAYAPDLGLFTSPDDVAGSALNPVTFARYLYAGADPETLVDPDGHCTTTNASGGFDLFGTIGNCIAASEGFLWGTGESAVEFVGGTVGAVASVPGHVADAAGCLADGTCRSATVAGLVASAADLAGAIHGRGQSVLADPAAAVRRTIATVALAGADWAGSEHARLATSGGFEGGREAGRLLGGTEITGLSAIYGVKALPGAARSLGVAARDLGSRLRTAAGLLDETLTVVDRGLPTRVSPVARFGETRVPINGQSTQIPIALRLGTAPTYKGRFKLPFGIHISPSRPFITVHINPWSRYYNPRAN